MNQTELCKIPKYIEFEYRNEQQMHCTVEISNLVDKVVSYKVRKQSNQDKVEPPRNIPGQTHGGLHL